MTQVIFVILLLLMVIAAVAAVMVRNLIKSAICLAAVSVFLTIILFLLGAPLAALFELSVCAGLITVVFVSAISLTTPYKKEEVSELAKKRMARFIQLPFILALVAIVFGVMLAFSGTYINIPFSQPSTFTSFKEVFWNMRQADILGQIIIVFAGVFAVVVLFKERDEK